jgi:protein translocase SecG subunit
MTVLITLHALVTLALIVVVLMQKRNTGALGGLAGQSNPSRMTTPRASSNPLAKLTTWLAVVFIGNYVAGFSGHEPLLLFALAVLFPQILLWILGPKYSHLEAELVWMVLASCFTAWGGTAYGIGGSRGWFFPARVAIPVNVSTLVISVWVFDVSTVLGNLMLSTTSAVVMALLSIGFVVMKIRQSR